MSYCGLLRQPAKRMLIFFNVDQTTAVLETTKVKHVLQGDMIKEGATVLVDFGKEEFEASVVKLHGKSIKTKLTACLNVCPFNYLNRWRINVFIYCITFAPTTFAPTTFAPTTFIPTLARAE